jgi:hypothetical protein
MSASTLRRSGAAFTITTVPWGGNGMTRKAARYECEHCRATIDYIPRANTLRAVDVHRKWLQEKGWVLNNRADAATCPLCRNGKGKATIDNILKMEPKSDASSLAMSFWQPTTPQESLPTENEQPVEWWLRPKRAKTTHDDVAVAPEPPETALQVPTEASVPPAIEAPATAPEPDRFEPDSPELTVAPPLEPQPAPTAEPTLTVTPTSQRPSSGQRLKIRFALDEHFDDVVGEYLGEESDQSIAENLGVPAAWVETIREVGYGPLLRTSEMKRRAAEITYIRDNITTLQSLLDATKDRLARLEAA